MPIDPRKGCLLSKRPVAWSKTKRNPKKNVDIKPKPATYVYSTRGDADSFVKYFAGETETQPVEEKTYFYKCGSCDSADYGQTYYYYQVVDCPSCGGNNITRWEALPNISREWSYCTAFGHDWRSIPKNPSQETCACCGATRDFTKK